MIIKWTADFAYAIGLIASDGCLSKDGRHIDLTSKDIEQIENFRKILGLENKIGLKRSSPLNDTVYYRVQFGNVVFYKFLLSIGLTPNKSKTISKLDVPDKYFADFLRGSLDGDGYTYSYWDKRWKSSFMLYTGFVCASKKHLEWIEERILNLCGATGRIGVFGNSIYRLVFAKYASLKLLEFMYYDDGVVCLKRKKFKIDKALGIIDGSIEREC